MSRATSIQLQKMIRELEEVHGLEQRTWSSLMMIDQHGVHFSDGTHALFEKAGFGAPWKLVEVTPPPPGEGECNR